MTRKTPKGLPAGFLDRASSFETIVLSTPVPQVLLITLSRPKKLNAFDELMIREMRQVIWDANFDDDIRAIIITGAGRAFCAGRDIEGLHYENNLSTAGYRSYVRANHELFDDMEAIEKPIIAAVNGICAGGGVEMAIACDFRIASTDAEFLLPENKLGVIPASGACSRMIQMIGMGRLKEMIMAVRPFKAEKALHVGLVTEVVSPDQLMKASVDLAQNLIRLAPQALGMAKHIINMCQNVDTETGRQLERLGQSILIRTADNKEGMSAFSEKRPPKFVGK
jgi:enoyl-CoA hydratase/carnithine racemase